MASSIFIDPGASGTFLGGITVPGAAAVNSLVMDVTNADTTLARTAAGKVSLTGTTPMLQFGGTTSSFPAIKQNGSSLQVRLADDSAFSSATADNWLATNSFRIGGSNVLLVSASTPTISSGFGTSPSIANNNGTAAFTVNVGTGGTATSGVIGLPTATNGWVALCTDVTANAAHTALQTVQTASATNSVTIESQNRSTGAATAWATGSVIRVSCFAF